MKQRLLAFLIAAAVVAGLVTVVYRVASANLQQSYTALEQTSVADQVNDFQRVLAGNLDSLSVSAADYASWTVTYDFMASSQPEYLEENYNIATLQRISVNLVLLLNPQGQVVLHRLADLESGSLREFPLSLQPFLQAGAPLVTLEDGPSARTGLILLPDGLMLVASRPVLTSDEEGPRRGTLIFGRYLTPELTTGLAETAGVRADILRVDDPQLTETDRSALQELMTGQGLAVRPLDEQNAAGYALLNDLYQRPVALLKLTETRAIFQQGEQARRTLLWVVLGVGLFFGLALALLGDWMMRTQAARQASQARYRHLVEQVNTVIYTDLNDGPATTVFISPQIETLTGYPAEQWLKDPDLWMRILHPDDRERVLAEHNRSYEHRYPFILDYRMLARDGRVVWVRDEAVLTRDPERGELVWQGLMSDITERKAAELVTQRQLMVEQLLARISSRFVNSPAESLDDELKEALLDIGRFTGCDRVALSEIAADESQIVRVYEWSADGVEPHMSHMEGLSMLPFQWSLSRLKADRLIRISSLKRLPPEAAPERERWTAEGLKSVLGLPVMVQGRLRGFLSVSSEIQENEWNEETVRALRFLSELIGSLLARRWALEALADSEERFRAVFEQGGAGIGLLTADGRLSSANPALRALLQVNPQAELPCFEQIFPAAQQEAPIQLQGLFEQQVEIRQVEQRFRRSDGSLGWGMVTITLVHSEELAEPFAVLMVENISQRKLTEKELLRRQELFEAVNEAAENFLQVDHFQASVERAFNRLGSVLDIDRVVVYKTSSQAPDADAAVFCRCLPVGLHPLTAVLAERLDFKTDFPRWAEEMRQRHVIAGPLESLPDMEASALRPDGVKSLAVLPVWVGEQWWGVVRFDDCRAARQWTVVELDALQVAVRIFGAALHRRETQDEIGKLYELEREQRSLAETLRRTAELLGQPLELDQVLDTILDSLGEALPHDAANLMLLDGQKANITRAHGYGSQETGGAHLVSLSPALQHMLDTGQGVVIADTRAQTRWTNEPHMRWMRSYAGAPVKEGGRIIGFLNLHSAIPNHFQPQALQRLTALADQVAAALRNGSLYEETRLRGHQMGLLNEITRASIQAETPEKLMSDLAGWMNELFKARGVFITRWDEANQLPIVMAFTPSLAERMKQYVVGPGEVSITSQVFESGRALAIENSRAIPGIKPSLAALFDNETLLGLPLAADGRNLGAVVLVFPGEHTIQPAEMDLANQAAGQLSLALSKARLIESEQHRAMLLDHQNRLLTAFSRVAARIVRVANLDQIMDTLGEELRPLGIGGLIAMRRDPEELVFYTRYSFLPPVPDQVRARWNEMISEMPFSQATVKHFERLFIERKPAYYREILDHTVETIYRSSGRQTRGLLSAVGVSPHTRAIYLPLIIEDRAMGLLALWGEQLETGDVTVLELFASQVAIAIHNANLYAEVRRLAITDELTGLFNQRGMVEVGQREVDRAQRLERSLVAMMIDLDHFKRVNDTYGHPVGNEVLAELAGRIKLSLRGFDVVCRYGGEEFLVLAVESGLESGLQIAERLRHAVEASPFSTTAGGLKITISLGVAALQAENDTLAGLIDRADQALLKAKAAGRNRVVAE